MRYLLLLSVLLLASCTSSTPTETPTSPEQTLQTSTQSSPETITLKNNESTTIIADTYKTSLFGKTVELLAYNNRVPGTQIRGTQGDTITLTLQNNLPFPTTLHAHGIRMENQFDGVPDLTQKPVNQGESFAYELTLKDPGLYWYHPHIREDYQQEMGMYGTILVEPKDPNYWSPVTHEETLILDDIDLDNKGQPKVTKEKVTHTLMGRFGNQFLINGKAEESFAVNKGETMRLYIGNIANVRPFRIKAKGLQWKLVGGDNGRVHKERMLDELVIQPSERYIVELLFTESGTASLEEVNTKKSLATFAVDTEGANNYGEFFSTLRTTEIIPEATLTKAQAENPARTLVLEMLMKGGMMMDHSMMGHSMPCHQMPNGTWMGDCETKTETPTGTLYPPINPKSIEWEDTMNMMNAGSDTDTLEWRITEKETGKSNMDIHWSSTVGSYEKLRIENPTTSMHPMQHPIHMHGQRFLVLSRDGVPEETLLWKDTVAIPTGSTYDLLVEYTNPGKWMFHCHIPEHMESGMMGHFEVK